MDEHHFDLIPAFALGALDTDEALLVRAHIAHCDTCRAELESFQAVLGALPYMAAPQSPPVHVKQQLLARINATTASLERPPEPQALPRWPFAITAGAIAFSLVLLLILFNKLVMDNAQFQASQQTLRELQAQSDQNQHAVLFITSPQTHQRILYSTNRQISATLYMQPGNAQAIVIVDGMRTLDPGQTYQFWLSGTQGAISCTTFNVTSTGRTVLVIRAPAPVSEYKYGMITIEQGIGASHPSNMIVISGELSAFQNTPHTHLMMHIAPARTQLRNT